MEKENTNRLYDLSDIQSNYYGPTATGMLGGSLIQMVNKRGKKVRGGGYEKVAYPEYINNADFQSFMKNFYLIRKISHTPSAGVYIIPPKKELDTMIKQFQSELKKEGIELDSEEAFKYAAIKELPYKRYIFTVFGGDNEHYKLDKEVSYRNFGIVKRVNLCSEVMYFKYESESEIMICNTEECKKGTKAKLIAKCNNGIYVFQGTIPEAVETKTKNSIKVIGGKKKRKANKKRKAMRGGEIGKDEDEEIIIDESEIESLEGGDAVKLRKNIQKQKMMLMKKNVVDEDSAGDFIANMALADYEINGEKSINKYVDMLSGDLLHSAFKIVFNDECDVSFENEYSEEDKEEIINRLMKKYKITNKSFDREKYTTIFKNIYKRVANMNLSPAESSKQYKSMIKSKFNKVGMDMLKADIATSMYRNGQSIETAIKFANSIDNDDTIMENNLSKIEYNSESNASYQTSRYNYIINKAITSIPLIGLNAQSYAPLFLNKPKTRSVFNSSKKSMKKKKKSKKALEGGAEEKIEEDEEIVKIEEENDEDLNEWI